MKGQDSIDLSKKRSASAHVFECSSPSSSQDETFGYSEMVLQETGESARVKVCDSFVSFNPIFINDTISLPLPVLNVHAIMAFYWRKLRKLLISIHPIFKHVTPGTFLFLLFWPKISLLLYRILSSAMNAGLRATFLRSFIGS